MSSDEQSNSLTFQMRCSQLFLTVKELRVAIATWFSYFLSNLPEAARSSVVPGIRVLPPTRFLFSFAPGSRLTPLRCFRETLLSLSLSFGPLVFTYYVCFTSMLSLFSRALVTCGGGHTHAHVYAIRRKERIVAQGNDVSYQYQ